MVKRIRKLNTELLIDGENLGAKKAQKIMKAARSQGIIYESKVYSRQCDGYTKKWSEKAGEYGIHDIRLYGGPNKDKVDKKIKKDAKRTISNHKNIDVICIATNDGGYVDVIEELRSQGKRVVVIGTEKAAKSLRESCNCFIKI